MQQSARGPCPPDGALGGYYGNRLIQFALYKFYARELGAARAPIIAFVQSS